MSSWIRTGHIWGVWVSFSQMAQASQLLSLVVFCCGGHILFPLGSYAEMWMDTGLCCFLLLSVGDACLHSLLSCYDAVLMPEFSQTRGAVDVTQWSEGGLFICKNHTDWTEPLGAYQVSVCWHPPSVSLHGPRCYPWQLMFHLLRCSVTLGTPI